MDFSSLDFDLDTTFDFSIFGKEKKNADTELQFIRAAKLNCSPVMFENAMDFAEQIDLDKDYFCLVTGSFVYGDIFEALSLVKDVNYKRIVISTLGMSRENGDSIVNLTDGLGAKHVDLIVSNYFTAVERGKLIPYMIDDFSGQPICVATVTNHSKGVIMSG